MALVLVAALAGAVATLAVGALAGMGADELRDLALLLLPAIAVSAAVVTLAGPLLAGAPLRARLVVIAISASAVALLNLAVLAELMFVSGHDAGLLALLLVYSSAVGVGAALAIARHSGNALERLAATSRRLAAGDLAARAGSPGAGPELDALASSLDEMASRLESSLARERAAEAQRRDLITAVSHDLRTPLASLQAMVEAIDDGVVEDELTVRRYVGEMRGAVGSLVALVDDLFELVQLDAVEIEAEATRARLEEVVDSALAACDAQAGEKRLRVETELNGAAAAPCSPRITRVVQNLLQNAIRHTPADGTVRVEARRLGEALEVAVVDSGEGIAPEALERVFDPFWRGDAARSGPGSGLGLTLASRIVEALGGEITVESRPRHGSRFAVVLPARPG